MYRALTLAAVGRSVAGHRRRAGSQQPVVDRYRHRCGEQPSLPTCDPRVKTHSSARPVVNDLCLQRQIPNPYLHDSFRSSLRFRAGVGADSRHQYHFESVALNKCPCFCENHVGGTAW
jgi:hypothetical protein